MRHIRKYNESIKREITKQDLEDLFAHAFDASEGHYIQEITIEEDSQFSKPENRRYRTNTQGDGEIDGFEINIHHSFYDTAELKDFKKYAEIIAEVNTAILRLKGSYQVSVIFFEEHSDSIIDIIIGK